MISTWYHYRDPCSTETLQVFQESIEWACSGRFSEKDVDEAKLSVFSQVPLIVNKLQTWVIVSNIIHSLSSAWNEHFHTLLCIIYIPDEGVAAMEAGP